MLFKTRGIVLHTISYSDKALIAKIYTELFGLQSYMISGARGKNSKVKPCLLQPLALVEMSVAHKEKNSMQRITEIRNAHPFASIPYDIVKSSIALFLNDIIYKSIREEENNPELFHFLYVSCQMLDLQEDNFSAFHLHFMVQLSKYLGFYPQENGFAENSYFDLREGVFLAFEPPHPHFLSPFLSRMLKHLISANTSDPFPFNVSNPQRRELLAQLIIYYELHLSSFRNITSHKVLEEVMA
jgi:DNA repair protein RecO (recombination protein O)